jgi:hydrogenase-4 component E
VGRSPESQPYVNITSSLVIAALLVLLAYAVMRPLVLASQLPTRGGLPLAMADLCRAFIVITRRRRLRRSSAFWCWRTVSR